MIQLREANARSSVSLIAPAHPPCRAPGAPDASDANRSRSRSDRLFTHTPPKTRDLARKIFSPKKSHLYGKSLSWRSSRARRRASSRAHLSVRGVPVQANPALIVCASARARPRQSHRTRQRTTRRRDATINRTNRAIFPRTFTARRRRRVVRVRVRVRPRGVRVAHLFVRARRVVRARAIVRSSHASAHRVDECRRAGAPVAPVASERKPGVASGDAVATLIIPVTFPHSTRRERHERTHARRRTPTPRIASSPATRAFVSARVRRRGRVSVVSARRGAASTNRRFVGVSARQRASERGVRRALTRTRVDVLGASRAASTRVGAPRSARASSTSVGRRRRESRHGVGARARRRRPGIGDEMVRKRGGERASTDDGKARRGGAAREGGGGTRTRRRTPTREAAARERRGEASDAAISRRATASGVERVR